MHLSLIALAILTLFSGSEASDVSTVTFLTKIGGGQKGYRQVTQKVSQAFEQIEAFSKTTISKNEQTIGLDASVSGTLKAVFDLSADFSYKGDFMSQTTEESSVSQTSKWEEQMTQTYTV